MNENTHIETTVARVEALLNYLDFTGEKPVTYMYKTENGTPQRTYQNVKHTMAILNGRAVDERLTLDGQGFALVHHPTATGNFLRRGRGPRRLLSRGRAPGEAGHGRRSSVGVRSQRAMRPDGERGAERRARAGPLRA